jgi:hypothetical protein
MVVQVLQVPLAELLRLMLAVVEVLQIQVLVGRVVLVAGVLAVLAQQLERRGLLTQVVVEVVVEMRGLAVVVLLAVQALSFFATPAQFNISLVAQ